MYSRSPVAYCVVALGLIAALPIMTTAQDTQTSPQSEKPLFWVESTSVDVGKVKAGDDAVATFVFHNNSNQPVKILKAKPS
jgi:allophanate hydrolase subunit 1